MVSGADKLIQRKFEDLLAKGQVEGNSFIQSYKRSGRISLYILFAGALAISAVALVGAAIIAKESENDIIFFGAMIPCMAGCFALYTKIKKTRRFYNLISNYRDILTVNKLRSMQEISTATETSFDEILSELKELQDEGFFRQFRIDRAHKRIVEDEDWGLEGSGEYEKRHFTCSSCGGQNEIYNRKGSNSLKCEYCDTVNVA